MMVIPPVTDEQELDEILNTHDIVIVDFWAQWCRACKSFLPILADAAVQHPEVYFCRVNSGEAKDLTRAFDVDSIPTLVVIRDRILIASQPGLLPSEVLEDLVQQIKVLDMEQVRWEMETQGAVTS